MPISSSRDVADRWPVSHVIVATFFLAFASGVFLIIRRATGAFTCAAAAMLLIATAAGLLAWAGCIRAISTRLRVPASPIAFWLPPLTLILFAVGCSYPGERWIDWIVWGLALAVLGRLSVARRPLRRRSPPADSDGDGEQLLQQLMRYRMADGRVAIRGTLIAEFAAGERVTDLYAAFCPAFETLPHAEANVADDSTASVKMAQLLHNGAQLEVRLPRPSDHSERVTIELFAAESHRAGDTSAV